MQADEKQVHVKAWQTSGLTKAAYAQEHGINSKTFSRWCRQYLSEVNGSSALLQGNRV